MLSRSRFTAVAFIIIALLVSSTPIFGQSVDGDWSRVSSLTAGTKVSIKLKNGKSLDGRVNSTSDSSLTITAKSTTRELKRDEVQSVYLVKKRSAVPATLIGMGAGAGAGAAIGALGATNEFDKLDQAVTAGLAIIGAGAGAITGYFIGRSGRKKELIYQAN